MRFIKKIQKKPRPTRLLILWLVTFLVMFIIIAIWLFSFSKNSKNFHFKGIEKEIEATNLPSLFKSIGKDFSIIKQRLEAGLKGIEEELPSEAYEK